MPIAVDHPVRLALWGWFALSALALIGTLLNPNGSVELLLWSIFYPALLSFGFVGVLMTRYGMYLLFAVGMIPMITMATILWWMTPERFVDAPLHEIRYLLDFFWVGLVLLAIVSLWGWINQCKTRQEVEGSRSNDMESDVTETN